MAYWQTCRTLRDLVQASVQLQYHIDLFSACMVKGDLHGVSYDECRRDLRLAERAWNKLRWRNKIDIKLPDFVLGFANIELAGGVMYVFDYSQRLWFERAARAVLPTLKDDETHWQPIWEDLGFSCRVRHIHTDVSQDLFVLLEIAQYP